MVSAPRAGTGYSACRNWRYWCSTLLNCLGNLSMSRGNVGKYQSDVESDEVDGRYMAEWGCEHRITVCSDHVFHVPFKLSRTSTQFRFSQASTSSSVLTTLDICDHYAKSFVSITESQKMWIGFFLDHDALCQSQTVPLACVIALASRASCRR